MMQALVTSATALMISYVSLSLSAVVGVAILIREARQRKRDVGKCH